MLHRCLQIFTRFLQLSLSKDTATIIVHYYVHRRRCNPTYYCGLATSHGAWGSGGKKVQWRNKKISWAFLGRNFEFQRQMKKIHEDKVISLKLEASLTVIVCVQAVYYRVWRLYLKKASSLLKINFISRKGSWNLLSPCNSPHPPFPLRNG